MKGKHLLRVTSRSPRTLFFAPIKKYLLTFSLIRIYLLHYLYAVMPDLFIKELNSCYYHIEKFIFCSFFVTRDCETVKNLCPSIYLGPSVQYFKRIRQTHKMDHMLFANANFIKKYVHSEHSLL